jgi:hypothetical protein
MNTPSKNSSTKPAARSRRDIIKSAAGAVALGTGSRQPVLLSAALTASAGEAHGDARLVARVELLRNPGTAYRVEKTTPDFARAQSGLRLLRLLVMGRHPKPFT